MNGYKVRFQADNIMYSPNNAVIKQSNYIAYAVRSGISCQLPRIDRKRSLDMRKLRLCSID